MSIRIAFFALGTLLVAHARPAAAQSAPEAQPDALIASPTNEAAEPASPPDATQPRPSAQQAPSAAASDNADNSGQDPTRPLTRVDVRFKYKSDPGNVDEENLTLRADKPFTLGGGWQLSTRVDVPLVINNKTTPDNPTGAHNFGLADSLIQAILITPPQGKWAFGAGTQIVFPTGTADQFTSGKWELVPLVAAVRQLPELSPGTFIGLVFRDTFSFAGSASRPNVNAFSVQPLFNLALPQRWFVSLQPEIKFDTLNDWHVFFPFDITVGKKLSKNIVVSLQADTALIDDKQDYDWQLEARIGFFF